MSIRNAIVSLRQPRSASLSTSTPTYLRRLVAVDLRCLRGVQAWQDAAPTGKGDLYEASSHCHGYHEL
jgi:hypothetical protein